VLVGILSDFPFAPGSHLLSLRALDYSLAFFSPFAAPLDPNIIPLHFGAFLFSYLIAILPLTQPHPIFRLDQVKSVKMLYPHLMANIFFIHLPFSLPI